MAVWPADDSDEWGEPLKQYIDAGDAGATPPVDEAVALLVGTEGTATHAELIAQTVTPIDEDGDPLVGKKARIVFNEDGFPVDIILEDAS